MKGIEELRAEIARLERRQEILERWQDYIRPLEEISDDEKIKAFDLLYEQALYHVRLWIKDGFEPDDGQYYLYETVMEKTLNKDIWFLIRTLANC
jgi:hypothetical protein